MSNAIPALTRNDYRILSYLLNFAATKVSGSDRHNFATLFPSMSEEERLTLLGKIHNPIEVSQSNWFLIGRVMQYYAAVLTHQTPCSNLYVWEKLEVPGYHADCRVFVYAPSLDQAIAQFETELGRGWEFGAPLAQQLSDIPPVVFQPGQPAAFLVEQVVGED